MRHALLINSSVTGLHSVTRQLVQILAENLGEALPGMHFVARDLGLNPIPHLTPLTVAGVRGEPSTQDELRTRALSDALVGELRAADLVVIGAPMYNFGIPSTLKAWFDHVIRPGGTFTYSDGASRGLIEGKRVILVESRGGRYSEGEMLAWDYQDPYLHRLLAFIGLADIDVIRAEGVALGDAFRTQAIETATTAIEAVVAALPGAARQG